MSEEDSGSRDPGRVAAFSDAVVAVAMTALVLPLLELDFSPITSWPELMDEYGSELSAFFFTFLITAVYWVVHHKYWLRVKRVTKPLIWINMGFLLGIVLTPLAAVANWEIDNDASIGIQFYSVVMMITSLFLGLLMWLITSDAEICGDTTDATPLWFAQRYFVWWLIVTVANFVDFTGIGEAMMRWSGLVIVVLALVGNRRTRPRSHHHDGG